MTVVRTKTLLFLTLSSCLVVLALPISASQANPAVLGAGAALGGGEAATGLGAACLADAPMCGLVIVGAATTVGLPYLIWKATATPREYVLGQLAMAMSSAAPGELEAAPDIPVLDAEGDEDPLAVGRPNDAPNFPRGTESGQPTEPDDLGSPVEADPEPAPPASDDLGTVDWPEGLGERPAPLPEGGI